MGYGDVQAHTDLERIYACIVMICGVVGYGYFISTAASYFVDGDYSWRQYRKKVNILSSYLKVFCTIMALVKVIAWMRV